MPIGFQNSSGTDVIFNSSGCDPFCISASPKSHYIPSLVCETTNKLKNTILTPEKVHKITAKDNKSYVPLSYSFCGEESDSSKLSDTLKLPLESLDTLSKVEDNSNKRESSIIQVEKNNCTKTQGDSEANIFLSEEELETQNLIQPKMSSTQRSSSSNLSQLVHRFRYGKPLPPSERKSQGLSSRSESKNFTTRTRSFSGEDRKKFEWLNSDVATTSSEFPDLSQDCRRSGDNSIDELQQRVEKILTDSTSTLQCQPLSDTSAWSSTSHSFDPKQDRASSVVPSSVVSSVADSQVSASLSMPFSSCRSRLSTPHLETDVTKYTQPSGSSSRIGKGKILVSSADVSNSTARSVSSPSKPSVLLDCHPPAERELPPTNVLARASVTQPCSQVPSISFQDDILQQWRLRRKIEAARTAAANPVAQSYYKQGFTSPKYEFIDDQLRFVPAEKPLDFPQFAEKRSVGVSAVSMTAAQTQTSPTSSNSDLEFRMSSRNMSHHVKKNENIVMHKVTVVSHNGSRSTSPPSATSRFSGADAWSDLNASNSVTSYQQKARKVKTSSPSKSVASPTTSMVKKVVGARLFDVSADTLPISDITHRKTVSNETFTSSRSDQTASDGSTDYESREAFVSESSRDPSEKQSKSLAVGDNPDVMLQDLLKKIEEDVDDFKDDPVLVSLREQRKQHMIKLHEIDQKLKKLQGKTDLQIPTASTSRLTQPHDV